MSTTLFCTASRAAQQPQQDRYRKLGLVLIELPQALCDMPDTPRTTIRIMRQSAIALEQAPCTAGAMAVAPIAEQASQLARPMGVASK